MLGPSWRSRADSNRCRSFCRAQPSRSATRPFTIYYFKLPLSLLSVFNLVNSVIVTILSNTHIHTHSSLERPPSLRQLRRAGIRTAVGAFAELSLAARPCLRETLRQAMHETLYYLLFQTSTFLTFCVQPGQFCNRHNIK